jgi:hypothetical protein
LIVGAGVELQNDAKVPGKMTDGQFTLFSLVWVLFLNDTPSSAGHEDQRRRGKYQGV